MYWALAQCMTSTLTPALCAALFAALFAALPFAVAFVAAMLRDVSGARRDSAEGVLATCMGLRLTENHLIVGDSRSARRIALTGLTVSVESDGSALRVAVHGAGQPIERREPYSYGASGQAQIFATTLTRLSRARQPAGMNAAPAYV